MFEIWGSETLGVDGQPRYQVRVDKKQQIEQASVLLLLFVLYSCSDFAETMLALVGN